MMARGKEGDRGWDLWMASSMQWTWVWANSGRWWRIGKPGVLQSMGSQKVRHDLVTEQQILTIELINYSLIIYYIYKLYIIIIILLIIYYILCIQNILCVYFLSSQSYGFSSSHVWMWELDCEESWAPKNWCFWPVVLEKAFESPWTAKRSNQSILKEISVHWKDWCWSWNSNTWATWCEELTHLKRPWCWERLRAGGEGEDKGWDGWMASPTQWTWVWVDSGSWWWTGRPGVLWFIGSQRAGHDWVTELNWTDVKN